VPLQRKITLPLLTFYGLGSIIGAGIYVLLGEVASIAREGMGLSFLLAGFIAGLTGVSYAELSSRHPESAGSVLFIDVAFGKPWLSRLMAITLLGVSAISSAVICHGFVGYFQIYVGLSRDLIIVGLGLAIFLIASADIKQSTAMVAVITVLEVIGLVLVAVFASELPMRTEPGAIFDTSVGLVPIFSAAFIAFYAFIGFEDMVNVAEEVIEPRVTMPWGVLLAVIGSSLLYFAVAAMAVWHIDLDLLANSTSPIATMVGHRPGVMNLVSLISMVAIINGAIVQVIMSARVLYGMADRGLAPSVLGKLSSTTNTPVLSTGLACAVVVGLALSFEMINLAHITSALMLLVFAAVNISLIWIKRQNPVTGDYFSVPMLFPVIAFISTVVLFCLQMLSVL
jgi:amino acid transporter